MIRGACRFGAPCRLEKRVVRRLQAIQHLQRQSKVKIPFARIWIWIAPRLLFNGRFKERNAFFYLRVA